MLEIIVDELDNLKAKDILVLDVKGKSPITDHLIICTGNSSRHVASLGENLMTNCKQKQIENFGAEGFNTSDWIVVDFGQVMVHIMQEEARNLYQLEKLWA
ncbi:MULTISPECIES: ribosome silencing factor [Gallibacterium]|uniref:Ribosomal silencing factor RsfS n=1 Tax=Gallibacterium genomosp. 3 TaxID=505345 RepID=A0A1A7PR82_9PAST|nr:MULTISPECIES: ribosome silencing factor [Gallibacterium]MDA3978032.1 ribosome silencing factor [Gallibacterium sp. AGMB14963]OBX04232.1 ribosome-associated protein IOJAP [Gallibacterium genomosp. 3]OBX10319.1 ribosome-associated protein IOJAP [Gallibacterium genomosp. 3]